MDLLRELYEIHKNTLESAYCQISISEGEEPIFRKIENKLNIPIIDRLVPPEENEEL